jgi:hypothetical protein
LIKYVAQTEAKISDWSAQVFEKLLQRKNRESSQESAADKSGVKLANDRARVNRQRALTEFLATSSAKPAT